MVAYDILCFRIKSLKSWVRIILCKNLRTRIRSHTRFSCFVAVEARGAGRINEASRRTSSHQWEELVGPTLLTCDNVEVSTTEALKDKKYVM